MKNKTEEGPDEEEGEGEEVPEGEGEEGPPEGKKVHQLTRWKTSC